MAGTHMANDELLLEVKHSKIEDARFGVFGPWPGRTDHFNGDLIGNLGFLRQRRPKP
jgi:hypothetical protein